MSAVDGEKDSTFHGSQEAQMNCTQDIIARIDSFVGSQVPSDSQLVSTQVLFQESQRSSQDDQLKSQGVSTSFLSPDGATEAGFVTPFSMSPTSDDKEILTISDDKEIITMSDDKEIITLSDDKEIITRSDDKEIIATSDDKEIIATSDDKEIISTKQTVSQLQDTVFMNQFISQTSGSDSTSQTVSLTNETFSTSQTNSETIKTDSVVQILSQPSDNHSMGHSVPVDGENNQHTKVLPNVLSGETSQTDSVAAEKDSIEFIDHSTDKEQQHFQSTQHSSIHTSKRKHDDKVSNSPDLIPDTDLTAASEQPEMKKHHIDTDTDPMIDTVAMETVQVPALEEDPPIPMVTEDENDPSRFDNVFDKAELLTGAWAEYETTDTNFLKGCKWSPDGTCILTNSDDNTLRLFNLPEELYRGKSNNVQEMKAVLRMREAELIYDYCWLPNMSSLDPKTCRFVSTSRDNPVHMWNAFTGEICASYRSFDQADELVAAHSVAFSPDATKLYCGFNKMIRIFDVDRPGRECQQHKTFVKQGQPGIISCISINPASPHVYAAGSYSRTIALYTDKREMLCMFQGQQGGVTQIQFSDDGNRLYSGGRKDPEILCWDIRNPGQIMFTTHRKVLTNQRIYFDIDLAGHYMVSGDHMGYVKVWQVENPPLVEDLTQDVILEPKLEFEAHQDTVNGISLHPSMPILATASGRRHVGFPGGNDSSDSDSEQEHLECIENSLKLWWIGR